MRSFSSFECVKSTKKSSKAFAQYLFPKKVFCSDFIAVQIPFSGLSPLAIANIFKKIFLHIGQAKLLLPTSVN